MNLVVALLISLILVLGATAEAGRSLFLGGFAPSSASTVQLGDLRPAILDDLMPMILHDLRPAILDDLRPLDPWTFVADQEPGSDVKLG
jgi:hypothetical protein